MTNPFTKQAGRLSPFIQTLVGGTAGTAAGHLYNDYALVDNESPITQFTRLGTTGLMGMIAGNPVTRRAGVNAITPYEKIKFKSKIPGNKINIFEKSSPGSVKMKGFEVQPTRKLSIPRSIAAGTTIPSSVTFLPNVGGAAYNMRENMSTLADDYANNSGSDESLTDYILRNVMEAIPDKWYNKAIDSYIDMTKETGETAINMLKDLGTEMKPTVNNITKEVGKGLVPVGTGFAAGGLMGNLLARSLIKRKSVRETAQDERDWDNRNRLINMASLLGATAGGLGGYKLFEHNLARK